MVRSAMAGSGEDFAEGRKRGKLRRIKNESNGRTSPAENRRIREFPPTQFEWQQYAVCLPQRKNSTALNLNSFQVA